MEYLYVIYYNRSFRVSKTIGVCGCVCVSVCVWSRSQVLNILDNGQQICLMDQDELCWNLVELKLLVSYV